MTRYAHTHTTVSHTHIRTHPVTHKQDSPPIHFFLFGSPLHLPSTTFPPAFIPLFIHCFCNYILIPFHIYPFIKEKILKIVK